MPQELKKSEVADLMGCSTRTVERKLCAQPQYEVDLLPADAQQAWAARQKVVEFPQAGMPMPPATPGQLALTLTMPVGPNLSDADRAEAERRFGVIEPLINPEKYLLLYTMHASKGALIGWLAEQHQVKPRTIYAWLEAWQSGGLPALVSRDRSDKGKPRVMSGAALDFLLAAAMPRKGVYGVLSVREIYRAYEEERVWRASHAGRVMGDFEQAKYARYLDEDGRLRETALLPEVSYKTLQRWFDRIPEVAKVMARQGDEAFHNSQEIISFRAIGEVRPLQYVVMDHRVLDIFCLMRTREGWRLGRPWLTAAIDMRTRKWLGWVIVETPSSDSIAAVLKRVFLDHGLPEYVYWDNGKDFRCEWLEGKKHRQECLCHKVGELGESWRGVLATLGVRVHHAIVKRARAKIIEPNFGRISKFDETLPEFCGHKPTGRPERFNDLVRGHERWLAGENACPTFRTIEQVTALYNDAIEDLNERDLAGEGMRKVTPTGPGWMCPNEAWEILIRRVERRTVPADVLHFCFAKRRELTVKHGEVKTQFAGRDYHYRLTGNQVALMALNGQTVEFAYDPLDLGEAAIYYQSRFVGLANCVELRRMGEDAFVEDERNRRTARREVKKFIDAVHKAVPIPDPETRLARRKAVLPARENVARVEIPAELPAAVVECEAATRADREFEFVAAEASVVSATETAAPGEDEEFRFFQGD
jgi:transposase InsO family protein